MAGLAAMLWGLVLDALLHFLDPHLAAEEGLFSLSNPGHLLIFVGVATLGLGLVDLAVGLLRPASGGAAEQRVTTISTRQRRALMGTTAATVAGAIGVLLASAVPHGGGAEGGHAHAAVTRDGITELSMEHDGTRSIARTAYDLGASPTLSQTLAALDVYHRVKAATQPFAAGFQVAQAAGYSISDQVIQGRPNVGIVHFTNPELARDGRTVDPERPEVLIYAIDRLQSSMLIGAMFLMPVGQHGPQFGGPMTMWHVHPNMELCVEPGGAPVIFRPRQPCPTGLTKQSPEMLHVWLVDNPDGVFAHDMAVLPPELRAR
jgi:hypothetical protein